MKYDKISNYIVKKLSDLKKKIFRNEKTRAPRVGA